MITLLLKNNANRKLRFKYQRNTGYEISAVIDAGQLQETIEFSDENALFSVVIYNPDSSDPDEPIGAAGFHLVDLKPEDINTYGPTTVEARGQNDIPVRITITGIF